ncbi:MAG: hypothetical protein OQK76_12275 [Gammaproteobacteria bacterium]|nr:hypothetical protein [Gammaproteobacteria bacterium]
MKINLFVLAFASILLSSPVSASRVPVDFDHKDNHALFDYPGKNLSFERPGKHSDNAPFKFEFNEHSKHEGERPTGFNPHQGYELAGLRNFHAEGHGWHGLALATAQISAVPVPAAIWLFTSGLVGIIAVTRRKKP